MKYIAMFKEASNRLVSKVDLKKETLLNLNKYKQSFLKSAKIRHSIGLNEESGLKGKMRKFVHASEDILAKKLNRVDTIIAEKRANTILQTAMLITFIIISTVISTLIILQSIRKPLNELEVKTEELEYMNNSLENIVKERTIELENQLYRDSLTKLYSYHALSSDIETGNNIYNIILFVDIDNFQNINNIYGFDTGNCILKEFANSLIEFNKNNDYKIYRIFADQFALLKNPSFLDTAECYEDLLALKEAIRKFKFHIKSIDENIQLDATIGMSLDQDNPIETADMALRYAKTHNLGHQVYNTMLDVQDKLENTLKWKDKIKEAIKDDRVIPVYQPIVDREQKIIKYEVLCRIQENVDGKQILISPFEFLQEAINTKQYNNIMKIIFKKTFDSMATTDKLFSINISYSDIFNTTLTKNIEKHIKENPKLAQQLVIEILETEAIEDTSLMQEFITKFKNYGVKIAIDDFGVGHSNLSHIMDIDLDYLKIDGAFIKNININKESYAMVKAIIAFCKELDITVIAEYVHSKEVFDILYELGIDEYQGYYFSPPKIGI
ncbi:MAG: GGDEF domain-containing phosphodiesterase [Campylobacterota bacterium]